MAPTPKPRRVSYVIPPPASPPTRLLLPPLDTPRYGNTAPLLIPREKSGANTPVASTARNGASYFGPSPLKNPQHRLGVTALALDTSTTLSGHPTPEGILYSGGRDGLVVAWEQGMAMQPRKQRYGTDDRLPKSAYHWESMTGWEDDETDDDEDDEWVDAAESTGQDIPFEQRWEPDYDNIDHAPGTFRQCVQAHTDWINDIVLCNFNRTVVSASNDGTLKAWNPHGALASDMTPTVIGDHMDYVRCLAYSRERNWVASGSFDRTVKLWDLQQPRPDPLTTLALPETLSSAKGSIYALATHAAGHLIAAGSPERVVRIWDPRSGKKASKLVGHTDNIRALLLSEDGRYVLSGSSDATIKLWSLTAQRCLHTFTYDASSVWTLASEHPNLEIFYSGDRAGVVCKVDVENCADVSEGECVVVCKDVADPDEARGAEGVNKIVAADDLYIWTATSSSSIKRWSVPRRRADRTEDFGRADSPTLASLMTHLSNVPDRTRSDSPPTLEGGTFKKSHQPRFSTQSSISATGTFHSINTVGPPGAATLYGIPFHSLVKLASPRELYSLGPAPKGRDTEIATLYSAVSIRSVPALARTLEPSSQQPTPPLLRPDSSALSPSSPPSIMGPSRSHAVSPGNSPRDAYEERDLAIDAVPLCLTPNSIIQGSHGLVRSVILNDRLHALTVDTAGEVAVWDLVRGVCVGVYSGDDVGNASNRSISSGGGGVERSPREALETVKERIEGEAVCAAWCTVDTNIGHLTVHMVEGRCFDAEIYVDEAGFEDLRAFPDDHKVNIGKWVLTNLFSGFIRAEVDLMSQSSPEGRASADTEIPQARTPTSAGIVRGAAPMHISLAPTEGRRLRSASDLSNVMRTPGAHPLGAPAMTPAVPLPSGNTTPSRNSATTTPVHHKLSLIKESALTPIPASPTTATTPVATVVRTPSVAGKEPSDYFASGKTRARSGSVTNDHAAEEHQDPAATPGGRFMGRLRNFGKSSKRPSSADATAVPSIQEDKDAAGAGANVDDGATSSVRALHLKALNSILSQPLTPTPDLEAPPIRLPPDVAVMISEETPDASGWMGVYSSLVSTTQDDVDQLEMAAPIWLLELLLLNKAPTPTTQAKVSFIVVAHDRRNDPVADSSRLTAGRILRIRKILQYVRDKLEPLDSKNGKNGGGGVQKDNTSVKSGKTESGEVVSGAPGAAPPPPSQVQPAPVPPSPSQSTTTVTKPEDEFELVCNDVVVPISMTIGAVRHYIWRQGGELTMYYRPKVKSAVNGV